MSKFRYTLCRWRRSLLGEPDTADLGLITAEVYEGCMGLPQEVVDRIMNLLQDDKRDLKACSSTCKAMFASTRHLIHQTLHITRETDQMILTPKKKKQHGRRGTNAVELRYVSFMAERDLLKYTRHVNVHMGFMFSPGILAMGSHVQHLQSLDRVHTLTIHSFDAWLWPPMYNTSLSQFYPTLTTLALYSPTGCYRLMLQFALQFPNLENLTLESLRTHIPPDLSKTLVVTQSPPLCGHLRCAGIDRNVPGWLVRQFAFDLPNGINFRSIEFQDVHWEHGQHILNGCASSLEEFALTVHAAVSHETFELGDLHFRENRSLRSVVLRTPFSNLSGLETARGWTSLSTITSPALSEFVLELGRAPLEFTRLSPSLRGNWDEIDRPLSGFLDRCPDFNLIIRTGNLYDYHDKFWVQAKEMFPLMAERNRIQFETSSAVDEYWRRVRF